VSQQLFSQQQNPFSATTNVDELTRQKYLEEEKRRLQEFEQSRQQGGL
jgi:hypothetical protein